jgi:uncharacterized DUF497 family protein
MVEFRWNEWNLEHATCHGVLPDECEYVVENAAPPYPEKAGDDRWLVRGATGSGWMIQVVYLLDDDRTIYVIHARPLTDREKRRYRRRRR